MVRGLSCLVANSLPRLAREERLHPVHYHRSRDGLLCFTTTGGGRRITTSKLHEFNTAFLQIPRDTVNKRLFDLSKLRELCFGRFEHRLYQIRFTGPSAKEYTSIDHAQFQSRKYIDPETERMKEIRQDPDVKIESFESDINVDAEVLAMPIAARFSIGVTSGVLHIRFPKVVYRDQLPTIAAEAAVFYRLADATVNAILDSDYYAVERRSLKDLNVDDLLYPEIVELAPFQEVLRADAERRQFIMNMDVNENWSA